MGEDQTLNIIQALKLELKRKLISKYGLLFLYSYLDISYQTYNTFYLACVHSLLNQEDQKLKTQSIFLLQKNLQRTYFFLILTP